MADEKDTFKNDNMDQAHPNDKLIPDCAGLTVSGTKSPSEIFCYFHNNSLYKLIQFEDFVQIACKYVLTSAKSGKDIE